MFKVLVSVFNFINYTQRLHKTSKINRHLSIKFKQVKMLSPSIIGLLDSLLKFFNIWRLLKLNKNIWNFRIFLSYEKIIKYVSYQSKISLEFNSKINKNV